MGAARCSSRRIYRHARGFSLISLVIGLGVGLFAIELGVQWLGISRQQWYKTEKSLSADRNDRTLFLSLKQDLKACGYRGVRQRDAHYSVEAPAEESIMLAVQGNTVSSVAQTFSSSWRARLLPDSDVLEIADIPVAHCAVEGQESDVLQLKDDGNDVCAIDRIKVGMRALLADAQGAVWLRVAEVNKKQKRVKLRTTIHRIYGKEAIFSPVVQLRYFAARSKCDPKKRYALWRRVKEENPTVKEEDSEELLLGITAFSASIIEAIEGNRVRVTWSDDTRSQSSSVEISVSRVEA